jgi:hypothetical protein
MLDCFLPSPQSSINHILLGSRSRHWANLDNGQRSALVCGPRKFDKTARREAVAVIHANSGLPSGHISLSSVAPYIS